MKATFGINGLQEEAVSVYWEQTEQQNPARKQLPLHWPVKYALLSKGLGCCHPDEGRKLRVYTFHCNRGEHVFCLSTKIA